MKIFSIICEATNSLRLRRKCCRHHLQPLFLSNPRQKLFFEDRLLMHIIRGLKNVFEIPLTDAIHPNLPPSQHAYPWQELSGSTRYGDFPKKVRTNFVHTFADLPRFHSRSTVTTLPPPPSRPLLFLSLQKLEFHVLEPRESSKL